MFLEGGKEELSDNSIFIRVTYNRYPFASTVSSAGRHTVGLHFLLKCTLNGAPIQICMRNSIFLHICTLPSTHHRAIEQSKFAWSKLKYHDVSNKKIFWRRIGNVLVHYFVCHLLVKSCT